MANDITYLRKEAYTIKGVSNATKTTYLVQISLKSTVTKPTDDIVHGSMAIEEDTGDFYLFDGTTWNKMCTIKED